MKSFSPIGSSPSPLARARAVAASSHSVTPATTVRWVRFLAVRGDSLLIALANQKGVT